MAKVVTFSLPDGSDGHIRVMSLRQLNEFRKRINGLKAEGADEEETGIQAVELLVACTACNSNGELIYTAVETEYLDHQTAMAYYHVSAEAHGMTAKKN